MTILNLTQHNPTKEQETLGVVNLPQELREEVIKLITFNEIPTKELLEDNAFIVANAVAYYAKSFGIDNPTAMIGGAPYFMGHLEAALKAVGIKPVYAFSVRESIDEILPDGSIKKVAVFRHAGWVEV